ncbi:MAG TPA: HNH endonuclease [Puia sp.]|jgi:hypothetical protein|nr:HNH endonuclease [Puia sp.]
MSTIEIPLTKGKFAIIDFEDLEFVMRYKWHLGSRIRSQYAIKVLGKGDGKKYLRMHNYIMNCPNGKVVDHIDGDGLNNKKANLRICDDGQNKCNRKKSSTTKNRFKGAIFRERNNRWICQITHKKKRYYVGEFKTEIEAAQAYNKKAKELFGDFSNLNDFGWSDGFGFSYGKPQAQAI